MDLKDLPKVTTWKGRDIASLSREELIEALEWCAKELYETREARLRAMETFRLFACARP